VFRHIRVVQAAIDKLSALWRDAQSLHATPPIGVAPLEARVQHVEIPALFGRRAPPQERPLARMLVADAVGRPFSRPWEKPLPNGYFWKQDRGALDGIRHELWRIYRGRL
jgi:hypothetical protein